MQLKWHMSFSETCSNNTRTRIHVHRIKDLWVLYNGLHSTDFYTCLKQCWCGSLNLDGFDAQFLQHVVDWFLLSFHHRSLLIQHEKIHTEPLWWKPEWMAVGTSWPWSFYQLPTWIQYIISGCTHHSKRLRSTRSWSYLVLPYIHTYTVEPVQDGHCVRQPPL